jgi:hypothetical protein
VAVLGGVVVVVKVVVVVGLVAVLVLSCLVTPPPHSPPPPPPPLGHMPVVEYLVSKGCDITAEQVGGRKLLEWSGGP